MEKLIKKLLREEIEVKEMGINISRLKKLYPKQYLAQRVKELEKEKPKFEEIKSEFEDLIEKIKNISWEELSFQTSTRYSSSTAETLALHFPREIERQIKHVLKIGKKIQEYEYKKLGPRMEDFLHKGEDFFGSGRPFMQIEHCRNRTHFPHGLAEWLKNLGLGFKMYRKILNDFGFMLSEENASGSAQKIYTDLIQLPEVNCVLEKSTTLVMDKSLPKERKERILTEFLIEQYVDFNERKFRLNKTIVLDSALLSQLGKDNVERLIEDTYKLSKDKRPSAWVEFC